MDKKKRIEELVKKLNDYAYNYYTLDQPKVSDKEYDELYDELLSLEKETEYILKESPTQRIGEKPLDKFEKYDHKAKLWSLDKAQNYQELRTWDERINKLINEYNSSNQDNLPKVKYVLEYKFDGLTINLTYENGYLVQGASRGNGETGEAILPQIKTIKTIPLKIDYQGIVEIQGEGLMPISALNNYNQEADEPLKNARNAAAGALRNLDPKVTEKRNLAAYFYNVGYIKGKSFETHKEMLNFIKDNRIPVFDYLKEFENIDDLIKEIEKVDELRNKLDVLTDGMVVKINDIKTREVLGSTQKFPRWAVAFKFEAEEVTTILKQVKWNVGRSGKVTPSAVLEPVEIAGATIQRATLNNIEDIRRKKVKINSRVWLRRSNDVIPEILGVVEEDRETEEINMPENCPACGTELIKEGVHYFCPNKLSCKPQLVSSIVHFASRDAMNIEGFSEKTAYQLYDELDIKDISQLYDIEKEKLLQLEGFKEKKSQNLINALEKSKDCKLESFIYALGIPNVGIKTAKDLVKNYESLDNLRNAKKEELIEIRDIGEVVAEEIYKFFNDKNIKENINKLLNKGINPYYEDKEEIEENIFTNKKIVITGSFGITRKEIKSFIEKSGGQVTGSVSSNTDFLVMGENPGSKYDKAKSLGIRIIDKNELNNQISIDRSSKV
ncbi:MAG: NAD-dependent DNA ligase LigA [Eubacteriales bacterium]